MSQPPEPSRSPDSRDRPPVDAIRLWTEDEFASSQERWDELRARSAADPLFMSWDWQWRWWQLHRSLFGAALVMVACYAGPRLVGVGPFFLRQASHRFGVRGSRLELIGSTWRNATGGVFSEYLDILADRAYEGEVAAALGGALRDDDRWDGLVVSNTPAAGVAARMVRDHLTEGMVVRRTDPLDAHWTELPSDFDSYVSALAGGTRRKLWNHRSKLSDPQVVLAGREEVPRILDQIDEYHLHRWHAPLYVGVARAFHADLADVLAESGALRMSTLRSGGKPIAVMYNVRLAGTEYNLQSGFSPKGTKGVSPGYLHFGYCMEAASRDGIRRFDFLAGEGRNRQYKEDFLTTATPLVTMQVLRARKLRWLYQGHALLIRWGLRG